MVTLTGPGVSLAGEERSKREPEPAWLVDASDGRIRVEFLEWERHVSLNVKDPEAHRLAQSGLRGNRGESDQGGDRFAAGAAREDRES